MKVTIWGCRGSLPTPGPETVGYGGNTSCVEVALENGDVLVLDAGSGIRRLGLELLERGIRRLDLLLTHLHLDHVEGLRFFAPLFDERVRLVIWGPPSPVSSLEERIARSFSPPLFPIDLRRVPAQVSFHDVPRGSWTIHGASLSASLVAHPGPTLGFRIDERGQSLAYIPDHEPALGGGLRELTPDWISGFGLVRRAGVLLHDSQYFEEEYEQYVGFGHSSVADAVALGEMAAVGRLLLFHHDPLHSDTELEALQGRARALWRGEGAPPALAYEGLELVLE
jgi:phosphoribosyl 1,2-cyclic phosphodiesterase